MKQCPRCKQTYSDNSLNFCLDDGELLSSFGGEARYVADVDDAPPTVVLNEARVTDPIEFRPSAAEWQNQPRPIRPYHFAQPELYRTADQTLPTISLVLGILSVVLICCYGGIWLGLPALVVGFLGMRNASGDPSRYGGKGMAIGGMILGAASFLAALSFLFFAVLAR